MSSVESSATSRFQQAIALIDQANQQDPHHEESHGQIFAKEYLYSLRMTEWLDRFVQEPSEALQIAARAQHICRWLIPREQYPEGRKGYHLWRIALQKFHAEKAGDILQQVGYDEPFIQQVQSLLRKENLRNNPETQQLEDVICLVFLEHHLTDFVDKGEYGEDKLVDIVHKTWLKMSIAAQQAALQLTFPPHIERIVKRAVVSSGDKIA